MSELTLTASVGNNGVNDPDDVIALKERLVNLGFDWLTVNGNVDADLTEVINLVQSIKAGRDKVSGDGRVDVPSKPCNKVPGFTFCWLTASNAPGWQEMPQGFAGEGFRNIELLDTADKHDFGTTWMADTIFGAGRFYNDRWLSSHSGAALLTINDVSLPTGGFTDQHGGHETGMACDIRLPRTNGTAQAGTTFNHPDYDQDTMRAMLQAIRHQPLVERIFFNDPDLAADGLCTRDPPGKNTHDNHAHFELKPFLPITLYDRPVGELFDQAIIFFGGNPTIDPSTFPMTMDGFQDYLDLMGILNFSASEFLEPHHPDVATKLGYSVFLPPHEMWPRGAALGKLAQQIRDLLGKPVTLRNWWRPRAYNDDQDKVQGEPDSEHIMAYALDLDYQTAADRRAAEAFLKQLAKDEPWLQVSMGLGNETTHVGLLSPIGHRVWKYKNYVP
jgi:hypothetical protein